MPMLPSSTPTTPDEKCSNLSNTHLSGEKEIDLQELALDGKALAFDQHGHALIVTNAQDEARLRRKIDWHILPVVFLLYIFCFIDRASIGNARLSTFEKDLHMSGYDYNIAISVFFVIYAAVEIPSNILCKIIGPSIWIPSLTVAFGLVSMLTAFIQNFRGLLVIRAFLGLCEGGMMPGIAFYLTRWYRKDELVFRMGVFFVAAPLAGCFGGLLSSGLLFGDPIGSVVRWRKIFLVEGIISMGLGIIGFFIMTHSINRASWLNPQEKALAAVRIKSSYVATTELDERVRVKTIRAGIWNLNTWLIGILFLVSNVVVQGISVFLPTIIGSLFPTETIIQKQLRTVPPYIVGSFFDLLFPYLAWKFNHRALPGMVSSLFLITGFAMFVGSKSANVRYGATFIAVSGAFTYGTLCNSWVAINSSPDASRASAIGTVVMLGNIGGLISAWTYLPNAAPNYISGNSLNCALGVCHLILCASTWAYQYHENKIRESGGRNDRLKGLDESEEALLGHRHPKFRYSY